MRFLRICFHLLKSSLTENLIFYAVTYMFFYTRKEVLHKINYVLDKICFKPLLSCKLVILEADNQLRYPVKKGVVKNFANFTGKHNFIKKKLHHRCFPVNFARFLRTTILQNIYKRLVVLVSSV